MHEGTFEMLVLLTEPLLLWEHRITIASCDSVTLQNKATKCEPSSASANQGPHKQATIEVGKSNRLPDILQWNGFQTFLVTTTYA